MTKQLTNEEATNSTLDFLHKVVIAATFYRMLKSQFKPRHMKSYKR